MFSNDRWIDEGEDDGELERTIQLTEICDGYQLCVITTTAKPPPPRKRGEKPAVVTPTGRLFDLFKQTLFLK